MRQLEQLAAEIRAQIVDVVSENGGHLASSLGIVELTIALHYVFNTPDDKLIFDVGHQCYAHKILTGRRAEFSSLRTMDGLSGFPNAGESEYDALTAGHASTAISTALGIARGRDIMHDAFDVVAIVGDGALTGGMCYEALNDAGHSHTPMIVILNDNNMSIAQNVGALSTYLTHLRQSRGYRAFKRGIRRNLERIPGVGLPVFRFLEKFRDLLKSLFVDGQFFEALGFKYIGPIDGNNIRRLIRVLQREKGEEKPILIHIATKKGKGYPPAEEDPDTYHGVPPRSKNAEEDGPDDARISCGKFAGKLLADMAESDIRICAITAAMPSGTGMCEFKRRCAERFFDVGIAEEHAVAMAAGIASRGMKPYVAIYSTFLQRSYDQIAMEVCRNSLPVTFLIDRAGLVGEDGETHQGFMDYSYLRCIPNIVVCAPRDVRDLKRMICLSQTLDAPMAIRYPKDMEDLGPDIQGQWELKVGQWELINDGTDVMIFANGRMVQTAMQASIELIGRGLSVGVVDARFIKPMDRSMLLRQSAKVKLVVTVEENVLAGGFGEGAAQMLARANQRVPILCLGIPDRFIPHGTVSQQMEMCGLSYTALSRRIYEKYRHVAGASEP